MTSSSSSSWPPSRTIYYNPFQRITEAGKSIFEIRATGISQRMGRAHDATPTTPNRAPALKRKRDANKTAEATPTPAKRTRQRDQNNATILPESIEVVDLTGGSPVKTPAKQQTKSRSRRTPNSAADSPNEERRARRFRARPPQSLWDRLARAATQRWVRRPAIRLIPSPRTNRHVYLAKDVRRRTQRRLDR